jgi:hypothetical protein
MLLEGEIIDFPVPNVFIPDGADVTEKQTNKDCSNKPVLISNN